MLHGVFFLEDATHVYRGRLQPRINAHTNYELHDRSVYAIPLLIVVVAVSVEQRVARCFPSIPAAAGCWDGYCSTLH